MWPTSRGYVNTLKSVENPPQQLSPAVTKSLASVDNNQLRMAADSIRTLFGDNINSNILNSIRDNPSADRMETTLSQLTSRRPPERTVIDYENPNYSRLDRTRLSQMSSDYGSADQRYNDSPPLRREGIFDPTKMPQKSILKKSRDQSFDNTNFHTIEEEDHYLYGNPNMPSHSSTDFPQEILTLDQQNEGFPSERPLSPISLRLKREMEKMERSRRQTDPNDDTTNWTPRIGMSGTSSSEEPIRRNDWNDNEEELFKRRYSGLMNPSPDRSLELEKLRIQQLAAIQAGILSQNDNKTKRRELSPNSPLRHSYRRSSPELSPKRVRRRSPSPSPRRRRSISPRRRSRSPRKRSTSPRRRSISPRNRRNYRSRSRSRDRYRRTRSRSRTPPRRRSPNPSQPMNLMNASNPMPQMMQMTAQGMPFMRPNHNLVGFPMGPMIGQYMAPQMGTPFHSMIPQNIRPNIPNISPKQRPVLRDVPIVKSPGSQSSAKRDEKKEDKLLNPHDLLVAERAKLRDELESLKKQLQKKIEEQKAVVTRDNGSTESYAFRHLDKDIKDLKNEIQSKDEKLIKNFELINDVQKSKSKAKAVLEQLKTSRDISKVDLKKKESSNKSKVSPQKKNKSPEKKSTKVEPKQEKKEEINEDEEEEKNSRFHYFDSGPHWCKDCDKFFDNMKLYFSHIHSKDHLSKQKESLKKPWITKEYIKEMERQVPKNKDQLVVASKGIQFIVPTHGFYCELCQHFMPDSYQAEKHFKSAKHNRSYTRYTLLHNDYEHKWKAERDRAFTEIRRKERELEREKSKKEAERKVEERKRLEDEVKRKDREVKDRIEAMNKSLKTVKELDDPKAAEQNKEDKSRSSPKSSIRLNLSSNKSNEKSKTSDKSNDKRDKSKEKSEEKNNKLEKVDSMDTSEGIEDMLVIDEVNCDSIEDNNETQTSNENIEQKSVVFPKTIENDTNIGSKSDEINENTTETNKSVENIEVMDSPAEKVNLQIDNQNEDSAQNEIQLNEKLADNSGQIEGVVPTNEKSDSTLITQQTTQITKVSENNSEPIDEHKPEDESEDKATEEISNSKTESKGESTDTRLKTYAEVVAKGSDSSESVDKDLKSTQLENKSSEVLDNCRSVGIKEEQNENKLDIKSVKTENILDIDYDIEKFNERLKNFDYMVKKESIDAVEGEDEDPLDGFDVIDETNNDNTQEVIELSD